MQTCKIPIVTCNVHLFTANRFRLVADNRLAGKFDLDLKSKKAKSTICFIVYFMNALEIICTYILCKVTLVVAIRQDLCRQTNEHTKPQ